MGGHATRRRSATGVQEVLFGVEHHGGRPHQPGGRHAVDRGTQVTGVDFTVDVASIKSDESRRDSQFRGRVMSADEFPTATFTLTQPIELGATPADGAEVTTPATGDLTLRGVTKSVTFDVTAKQDNGLIGVQGSIPVVFNDYGIANPSNGGVRPKITVWSSSSSSSSLPTERWLDFDRNSRTRSLGRPMIASVVADEQRTLHDHLVVDDHVDDLVDGGDVGVGQAELREQRVRGERGWSASRRAWR